MLPFLLVLGSLIPAQVEPKDAAKTLLWAADPNGGIPYVFYDQNGREAGFEVDLADALARELGRPIELKKYDFNAVFQGLDRGDFDFAMNGLEMIPENLAQARFTRPYYLYKQQLVVRQGETRFHNLDEAKTAQAKFATLTGSAAERILKAKGFDPRAFKDQDGSFKLLAENREGINAVLMDLPIALYYAVPDPHLKYAKAIKGLELAGPPFAEGFYGIAVKKDNEVLAEQLDAALDKLLHNGEVKRILKKWELWNLDQYRLVDFQQQQTNATVIPFSTYFPLLLQGAIVTVEITLMGMALAILIALPIALCRLYGPRPLRWLAIVYVEFFRGIPVLLLLTFLYFGLPLHMDAYTAAVLGFGLNYAAYEAEIYRAGISSVPDGQWEAAASLGMSPFLTFRRIIFPQSFRFILPPMTNDLVALFKDTSVISVIAVTELNLQYQILTKSGAGYVQVFLVTAALYLMMSLPLSYLARHLERVWGRGK